MHEKGRLRRFFCKLKRAQLCASGFRLPCYRTRELSGTRLTVRLAILIKSIILPLIFDAAADRRFATPVREGVNLGRLLTALRSGPSTDIAIQRSSPVICGSGYLPRPQYQRPRALSP